MPSKAAPTPSNAERLLNAIREPDYRHSNGDPWFKLSTPATLALVKAALAEARAPLEARIAELERMLARETELHRDAILLAHNAEIERDERAAEAHDRLADLTRERDEQGRHAVDLFDEAYRLRGELAAAEARIAGLEDALKSFANIEVPVSADDGTWVARTIYCNDQITAYSVRRARAILAQEVPGHE